MPSSGRGIDNVNFASHVRDFSGMVLSRWHISVRIDVVRICLGWLLVLPGPDPDFVFL